MGRHLGITEGGLPYIVEHPDFPDNHFVLGFGAKGITFSGLGMDVIKAMLQNKVPLLQKYYGLGG